MKYAELRKLKDKIFFGVEDVENLLEIRRDPAKVLYFGLNRFSVKLGSLL